MDDAELQRLVAEVESIDLNQMRLAPDGSDKVLPITVPADYTLTPAHIRAAIRLWNSVMPRYYRGMLEAKLATPKNTRRR